MDQPASNKVHKHSFKTDSLLGCLLCAHTPSSLNDS